MVKFMFSVLLNGSKKLLAYSFSLLFFNVVIFACSIASFEFSSGYIIFKARL